MILRTLINIFFITLLITFTSTAYATIPCSKGYGVWLKANGETKCRPCPKATDVIDSKALKLPLGCFAPVSGALVSINLFSKLRGYKDYAKQMETFQGKLAPTLEAIQGNLSKSLKQIAEHNLKREVIAKKMQLLLIENSKYKIEADTYFWVAVSLGTLTTGLVGVYVYKDFR